MKKILYVFLLMFILLSMLILASCDFMDVEETTYPVEPNDPNHNHKIVIDPGYRPSCTISGLSDGKHCSECGLVLQEQKQLSALGHDSTDWIIVKQPSENENGYKYKECKICGEITAEITIMYIANTELECAVNDDGYTCTVLGIGSFTGSVLNIPEYIGSYKVTAIAENAFANCSFLTEINLPNTIKDIGTRAFYGCTGLTEFTLPESVKNIGVQIFYLAENLHTVYYNCTYADSSNPFLSYEHIKKVVFGGKSIPSYALYDCANIKEVIIKNTVKSIGYSAFGGSKSFRDIFYEGDITGWCNISINDMSQPYNLYINRMLVTDLVIPNSVTEIKSSAFEYCESLTSVTIPDSVAKIGNSAFYYCTSLVTVKIPASVTNIGGSAFEECTLLSDITIPNSVTQLGSSVFDNCDSLVSITIPDSVISMGSYVFYSCESLVSVQLSQYLTTIPNYSFANCTSLISITIPSSTTIIESYAFNGCSSLSSIVIPYGVTTISSYAFRYCESLKEVKIPASVTSIGDGAFYSCDVLDRVYIPESVTDMGSNVFAYCNSKITIYCEAESKPNKWNSNWDNRVTDRVIWGYTGE